MRLRTIAVLLYAAALSAQVAIDPARYRPLIRYLDPQPGETSFVCEVTPIRPSLNFSFRFQAGYAVRVPMGQFPGSGHRWNMVVEILPVAGARPPISDASCGCRRFRPPARQRSLPVATCWAKANTAPAG